MIEQLPSLKDNLRVVRFSVHGHGECHDIAVSQKGSFEGICKAIDLLTSMGIECQVTTVLTRQSEGDVNKIYSWCKDVGVTRHFLFGLMKSGKGMKYATQHGFLTEDEQTVIVESLQNELNVGPKITHYPYSRTGDCVLAYGDGRIVVDPCEGEPNFQKVIGNILCNSIDDVVKEFMTLGDAYQNYLRHYHQGKYQDTTEA